MKKMIDIEFGSHRYDELVELRYKVLLEPLGLKFLDSHRSQEAGYLHVGCIENLDDKTIRLMQVAVDGKYQGEGVGRKMVEYALLRAKEAGYEVVIMHAMLNVVGFYEKLGFKQQGDIFEEGGVTFAKMLKKI